MHDSALTYGKRFFEAYAVRADSLSIVEIGSQDVNGSLRSVAPRNCDYLGVDFVEGKGVDLIITDPYDLPIEDDSFDICVCSSCFEHSEFFWLLFNEILRILKPNGIFYLNAPSNGAFHRYPVDCWRFYPDSGFALQNWGRRSGHNVTLLESFTGPQLADGWNDFIAVFVKDEGFDQYPNRMQFANDGANNAYVYGADNFRNIRKFPEDFVFKEKLKLIIRSMNEVLDS